MVFGLAMSGPKSVIAPTPMKISGGKISYLIPKPMAIMTPISSSNPVFGKFAMMSPNAIGRRSSGSYCFAMARYRSTRPTPIIMTFSMERWAKPESVHTETRALIKPSMLFPPRWIVEWVICSESAGMQDL